MMRFHFRSCCASWMVFGSSLLVLMATAAFSTPQVPPASSTTSTPQSDGQPIWGRSRSSSALRRLGSELSMVGGGDDTNNNNNNNNNADNMLELSSTLARLDQQWAMEQRNKPGSRWTKLVLKDDEESDDDTVEQIPLDPLQQAQQQSEDFVYLLEPPNKANPSCVLVFTGGAGLGSFPHVAYNEFLLRLSNRLGAAIITAPYNVGLDHFALAKRVGELHRRALKYCQEEDSSRMYSPNLPTYCVAHSLGCKLSTIYMAATGQEYDGVAFLSFNNFGFGQTIGMAKEFAQQLRESSIGGGGTGSSGGFGNVGNGGFESFMGNSAAAAAAASAMGGDTMDTIFNLAENLLGTIGIEFSPNPADTERLISLRYSPERQQKTRLIVFDDDTLDSTPSFLQACRGRRVDRSSSADDDGDVGDDSDDVSVSDSNNDGDIAQVSTLPGTHLTPVYFKLGWEELVEDEDARNIARELSQERLGGFESASFGNEEELEALVDEVVGFVLGKEPTRPSRPLLSSTTNAEGDASS